MNEQGKLLSVATSELLSRAADAANLSGKLATSKSVLLMTDRPIHVADIEERGGYVPRSSELPSGHCYIVSD